MKLNFIKSPNDLPADFGRIDGKDHPDTTISLLRTALETAREYIALDARNKKYPLAIETLTVIDAALARS